MSEFKDHFSKQASSYKKYRPAYPDAWFSYLSGLCQTRDLAWDVATGSGQAAVALARDFLRVVGTDASQSQLENAEKSPRVSYRCEPAEHSTLEKQSVALVTVAQALHWFNLEDFYQEVSRVARPDGVVAVWNYGLHQIEPAIDNVVNHFYHETVGSYWPAERKWIEKGYRSLPFPFDEIQSPPFSMQASWSLDELIGYFSTWSATVRYREANQRDPLSKLKETLAPIWGKQKTRLISWPLDIRVGRIRS